MTRKQSNMILISVALLVIILGVAGYFIQKKNDSKITPEIVDELVKPYAEAISSGNYKYAYNTFTTEEYREEYSFEDFTIAQKNNIEKYGRLINLEPMTGIFLAQKTMYGSWHYIGTLRYNAEKKQERIQIKVEKNDQGKYLIGNTYLSLLQYDSRSNQPMIF